MSVLRCAECGMVVAEMRALLPITCRTLCRSCSTPAYHRAWATT